MTCTSQQRHVFTIALLLCVCLYIYISAWAIKYPSTWKRDTVCRVTVNHGVVNDGGNAVHPSGDISSRGVEKDDILNTRTAGKKLKDKWSTIITSSTGATTSPKTKTRMTSFPPTLVRGKDITPLISEFFQLKTNETKDDFVNLHKYRFSIDSKRCRSGSTFLAIIVHSAPGNTQKRNLIRETFGSTGSYKNRNTTVVFMVAAVKQQRAQDSLQYESQRYGDVVQGNFPDSYKNLVRKHIMAMHWFKYRCKAKYILKLDDDTFVNPYRIIDHILKAEPQGLTIECKLVQGEGPIRNKRSKWHTPESEYPFSVLPPFCIGFAYLTTPESWAAMYKVSETNRPMSMDDLYVSVVLAMKAGVQRRDFSNILVHCPRNKTLDYTELNKKAIVIDRGAYCGSIPFKHWRQIQYDNEHW
ncbi:beta-1,3-galactosyltransferase 1-like [Haliotis asinina]|uniref:beta-1,3-galactosyltransferase 1-like n=1 Tax=Haliotis asinina TaxID=109174 RepID=UPI00353276E4